jgi:UDP-4-amino-4,6-dideoxy-N-acetyl-beta-L-altrosamine N-acetyltransferase
VVDSISQISHLRPMSYLDLELVLRWRNHPDILRFMCTQHVITLSEHQSWFEQVQLNPGKQCLVFEVDKKPLGFVSFNQIGAGGIADWGFYTAPDAPKGSGRKLCRAAIYYAFSELEFHKICGQVLAFNTKSINFHQSQGFKQEGILRDHCLIDNHYHSVICFGLLTTEWQNNL